MFLQFLFKNTALSWNEGSIFQHFSTYFLPFFICIFIAMEIAMEMQQGVGNLSTSSYITPPTTMKSLSSKRAYLTSLTQLFPLLLDHRRILLIFLMFLTPPKHQTQNHCCCIHCHLQDPHHFCFFKDSARGAAIRHAKSTYMLENGV